MEQSKKINDKNTNSSEGFSKVVGYSKIKS